MDRKFERLLLQNIKKRNPMSQEQQILNHLQSGNGITQRQASKKFDCDRLSARIGELKARGYIIETVMVKKNGKRFGRYSLVK